MKRISLVFGLLFAITVGIQTAEAQSLTVEDRLGTLEENVARLCALHGIATDQLTNIEHLRYGNPGGKGTLLIKTYYVISHLDEFRIPDWTAYHLTPEYLEGTEDRDNYSFRADPDLPKGKRAERNDYLHSGYDQGHMAPAAAFKRNATAMSETFLLSNAAPQGPRLNRYFWRDLEAEVRDLVRARGSVWIFTGSLFLDVNDVRTDPIKYLTPEQEPTRQIAIPTHFYKAILSVHESGTYDMFAFKVFNPEGGAVVPGESIKYMVSIDDLETMTGLDFFALLPDEIEERLEKRVATNWPIRGGH